MLFMYPLTSGEYACAVTAFTEDRSLQLRNIGDEFIGLDSLIGRFSDAVPRTQGDAARGGRTSRALDLFLLPRDNPEDPRGARGGAVVSLRREGRCRDAACRRDFRRGFRAALRGDYYLFLAGTKRASRRARHQAANSAAPLASSAASQVEGSGTGVTSLKDADPSSPCNTVALLQSTEA